MADDILRAIVPKDVYLQEQSRARGFKLLALCSALGSQTAVAKTIGISQGRANQLIRRFREENTSKRLSPVERYIADDSDVRELAALIVDRERDIHRAQRQGKQYKPRRNRHDDIVSDFDEK